MKRALLPVILILAAVFWSMGSACGLITAPFSVPAAVAENHDMQLKGVVVDEAGKRITGVTMNVQKDHTWWDAALGSRIEHEDSSKLIDGPFDVWRRGSGRVTLSFDKPGYRKVYLQFDADHLWVEKEPPAATQESAAATRAAQVPIGMFGQRLINPLPCDVPIVLNPNWKPGQAATVVLSPQ